MPDLKTFGADIKDKESIIEILETLRNQDHEARKKKKMFRPVISNLLTEFLDRTPE